MSPAVFRSGRGGGKRLDSPATSGPRWVRCSRSHVRWGRRLVAPGHQAGPVPLTADHSAVRIRRAYHGRVRKQPRRSVGQDRADRCPGPRGLRPYWAIGATATPSSSRSVSSAAEGTHPGALVPVACTPSATEKQSRRPPPEVAGRAFAQEVLWQHRRHHARGHPAVDALEKASRGPGTGSPDRCRSRPRCADQYGVHHAEHLIGDNFEAPCR